ncbi:MAG: hypothetical protein GY803_22400, partial [Chloroflexi bacterium]|nr:hypothetical protein [Chloroflexota bacterium]
MNRNLVQLLILIPLLVITLLAIGNTPIVHSQSDPILSNDAVVNFPNDVVFHLELDNSVAIVDAALAYDVEQVSCLEANAQVPIEVDGATLEWTWVMSRSGNPPPGAELWWEWTLTDAGGRTFTTPRQTVTLADDRFKWRVVEAEGVRLHW